MPIFEYACESCGREFETLVRSDTIPTCPGCQSTQLHKRLSVFATASAGAEGAWSGDLPEACAPCGSCGHPDGPGSCTLQ